MRIRRSAIIRRCARVGAALVVVGGVALAAVATAPPVGASSVGPTWVAMTARVPTAFNPGGGASIDATSCPAPGVCVAVGSYYKGFSTLFADTLTNNGPNGGWDSTLVPNPSDDSQADTYFRSLSCPTPSWCVATGQYLNTPHQNPVAFASVLSGGNWTTTTLPLPPAYSDPNVTEPSDGLSCPAVGWCLQAGSYRDQSDNSQGFLDTLSNGSWTSIVAPLPAPLTSGLELSTASCGAVGSCVAAGPYNANSGNVIDVLGGGTWTSTNAPLPVNAVPNNLGGVSEVLSVSCPPNSTDCMGVGDYSGFGGLHADQIQSQNVAWSISGEAITATEVATPADAAANPQAGLNGVSCPVAGWCEAVGSYDSTTFPQGTPEAATYSGGTWTAQEPPGMSAADTSAGLDSVSCSWPGSCAAAGTIDIPSTRVVLLTTLTNGVWTGNDAVLPNGGDPTQESIFAQPSCVAGYCLTGGGYNGNSTPFLETHPNLTGYQEVASDGGLFSFNAPFSGSMGGTPLNAPIVGMAVEPDNGGYYEVASDGGVFAFNAPFQGSMGGRPLNKPIVGIAFDSRTGGYYEVASDGGIFAFNAPFYGSMGGTPLNAPIVGIAFDEQTGGYYEIASDGGIFAFNAPFQGSMGGHPLDKPMVGMAVDSATGGYYEVASDGGIFAFNAPFYGSMGGMPLNEPIVGMDFDYNTGGYYEVASDGGVFTFYTPFYGSMGGTPLNEPIVGLGSG